MKVIQIKKIILSFTLITASGIFLNTAHADSFENTVCAFEPNNDTSNIPFFREQYAAHISSFSNSANGFSKGIYVKNIFPKQLVARGGTGDLEVNCIGINSSNDKANADVVRWVKSSLNLSDHQQITNYAYSLEEKSAPKEFPKYLYWAAFVNVSVAISGHSAYCDTKILARGPKGYFLIDNDQSVDRYKETKNGFFVKMTCRDDNNQEKTVKFIYDETKKGTSYKVKHAFLIKMW